MLTRHSGPRTLRFSYGDGTRTVMVSSLTVCLLERSHSEFRDAMAISRVEIELMTHRISVGRPSFDPRPPNSDMEELIVTLGDGQQGVVDAGGTAPWIDVARFFLHEWVLRQRRFGSRSVLLGSQDRVPALHISPPN